MMSGIGPRHSLNHPKLDLISANLHSKCAEDIISPFTPTNSYNNVAFALFSISHLRDQTFK